MDCLDRDFRIQLISKVPGRQVHFIVEIVYSDLFLSNRMQLSVICVILTVYGQQSFFVNQFYFLVILPWLVPWLTVLVVEPGIILNVIAIVSDWLVMFGLICFKRFIKRQK